MKPTRAQLAVPALTLALALAACGKKNEAPTTTPEPTPPPAATEPQDDAPPEATPEPEPEPAPAASNLAEVLKKQGNATKFLEAVETADLGKYLTGDESAVTLLVPTDEAWEQMPKALRAKIAKKDELAKLLKFHMVPSKMNIDRVLQHRTLPTLLGPEIPLQVVEGVNLRFDKAGLVTANLDASNGMVHMIDQVLVPTKK